MIVGYKEYKYTNKNTKEYIYRVPQIKCQCGQIIGKYRLKVHLSRWSHFYYAGKLDEFNSLENKIDK
jgi:hypothetical protein